MVLPCMHAHRHSLISFATEVGVDAVLRKLLVNHNLGDNAHGGYIRGSVLGESLRAAQRACTDFCVNGIALKLRDAAFELDGKAVERRLPIMDWKRPFFTDVAQP